MYSYKTALGDSLFTQSILKSKFIGYLKHTETEDAAVEFISSIRKKHRDATHNCYGYILRQNNLGRYSDDGEPSSTAGLPIYDLIKGSGLMDVTIVVTRYFGGTLLGTGGLVRAYSSSAKGAVEAANIVTMEQTEEFKLIFDYKFLDYINNYIEKNPDLKIISTDYSDKITVIINIRNNKSKAVIAQITDITSNNFVIYPVKTDYLPW